MQVINLSVNLLYGNSKHTHFFCKLVNNNKPNAFCSTNFVDTFLQMISVILIYKNLICLSFSYIFLNILIVKLTKGFKLSKIILTSRFPKDCVWVFLR